MYPKKSTPSYVAFFSVLFFLAISLVMMNISFAPHSRASQTILSDSEYSLREPLTIEEENSKQHEMPRPSFFDASPSAISHFASAKQASTWLTGPRTNDLEVQVIDFENDLGKDVGASPWHIVSPRQYGDNSVTVWGTTLTDSYRILVDGDRFEAAGRKGINFFPISLTWNFVAVDNGNIIIPDADGFKLALPRNQTTDPTLLVLNDQQRKNGSIRIENKIEYSKDDIRGICNVRDGELLTGQTFAFLIPTFTGEIAGTVAFQNEDKTSSYLVILDEQLQLVTCGKIGETTPSNDTPTEPIDDITTAFYIPTGKAIVKMTYDSVQKKVSKSWEREMPIRGRTGTTPTLMNTTTGEKFVMIVDAKAAVASGLNGLIVANEDTRPSALVAVRREDNVSGPAVIATELPNWLTTVENSPSVREDYIAIANYTGYLPNGLIVPPGGQAPPFSASSWGRSPDAVPDFGKGMTVLKFDSSSQTFREIWQDATVQISGVPTISGGANMVYGTGAEQGSGKTYFYGYRLRDDGFRKGGEQVIRKAIGNAPFREATTDRKENVIFKFSDYQMEEGEAFDPGNNLIVLEDGSALISAGRSLIRVRDRQ